MSLDLLYLTLDATLRVSTPLIFASMAGLFSERSGIIDIGLEGKMLAAAFVAASVAYLTDSALLGLACACTAAVLLGLLHGFACISANGEQVLSGLAINILISGLTVVVSIVLFRQGARTPALTGDGRFDVINFPFAEWMASNVPIIGPLYGDVLSGHFGLVYLAILAVPVTWFVLFRTTFGLRLRACGELPEAVDTAGISVTFYRYAATAIAGLLCGCAGAYLSTAANAAFGRDMTAGRGYIALAALIFGKWKPVPAFSACLLFGFLDAMAIRLQNVDFPGIGKIPGQFIEMAPYVLTVLLLAGFIGQAIGPKAVGRPYTKEH